MSGNLQAIFAGLAVLVIVIAALVNQERRLAHLDDGVLTQPEVRDIYSRLAVIETRLDIDHAR